MCVCGGGGGGRRRGGEEGGGSPHRIGPEFSHGSAMAPCCTLSSSLVENNWIMD